MTRRRDGSVRRVRTLLGAIGIVGALAAVPAAQASKATETFDAAWTIIRDSHFDPTMNGVDWPAVKAELGPRAARAQSDGELRDVIRDMLGRLGLSHFALIPSGRDTAGGTPVDLSGDPGFDVRLVGSELLVTARRSRTAVRPPPVSVPAGGSSRSTRCRSPSSSRGCPRRCPPGCGRWKSGGWSRRRLRGPQGSRASLMFDDGTQRRRRRGRTPRRSPGSPRRSATCRRCTCASRAEERRTARGATAGVIRFNVWMPGVDPLFQQAVDEFRKADGIVVDLRGNPGGLAAMIMGISGHFLTERKPLGTMKTRDAELKFAANPRLVNGAGQRVEPFAGPVAILVDAMTGSASECFAGGMQALGRARVFGQTSMGQALPGVLRQVCRTATSSSTRPGISSPPMAPGWKAAGSCRTKRCPSGGPSCWPGATPRSKRR